MVKRKVKVGVLCPKCGGEIEAWADGEELNWSCPNGCLYDDPDSLEKEVEVAFMIYLKKHPY